VDYTNKIEGYEPESVPFQPRQDFQIQAQRSMPPIQPAPKQKAPARMPKEQALALVRRMKKGIVIGSLLCFGATVSLIVNQANSAVASQATTTTTTSSQSSSSSTTSTSAQNDSSTQSDDTSSQDTSSQSSQQQGGGYGFGSTNSGQPLSGSHTS